MSRKGTVDVSLRRDKCGGEEVDSVALHIISHMNACGYNRKNVSVCKQVFRIEVGSFRYQKKNT